MSNIPIVSRSLLIPATLSEKQVLQIRYQPRPDSGVFRLMRSDPQA
jgi:hypothetical protein